MVVVAQWPVVVVQVEGWFVADRGFVWHFR